MHKLDQAQWQRYWGGRGGDRPPTLSLERAQPPTFTLQRAEALFYIRRVIAKFAEFFWSASSQGPVKEPAIESVEPAVQSVEEPVLFVTV